MTLRNSKKLRNRYSAHVILVATFLMFSACATPEQKQNANSQPQAAVDWKKVDQAMGRTGAMLPGDVYRFNIPRSDLHVTVKGVEIKPALALGSWAAFKIMSGTTAMVMGDMVLTEDEVAPVMLKLQQGGVEQSALHHHVL